MDLVSWKDGFGWNVVVTLVVNLSNHNVIQFSIFIQKKKITFFYILLSTNKEKKYNLLVIVLSVRSRILP